MKNCPSRGYETFINVISNARDIDGLPPLHFAVQNKSPAVSKMLIELGADVNIQNNKKRTALMLAVYGENKNIVEMLLNAGADVNIKDAKGKRALDYVQLDGEIYKILLQKTSD